MTYQPTDEQIEALADAWADYSGDIRLDPQDREHDAYVKAAESLLAWPAFQAIIRDAQAEAWEDGVNDMADKTRSGDYSPMRNPYREAPTA